MGRIESEWAFQDFRQNRRYLVEGEILWSQDGQAALSSPGPVAKQFGGLRQPADYSDKPAEALTLFCARYLEIMLYQPSVQLSRVCMAEIARFPEGAAQSFDLVFTEVHTLLSAYLKGAFSLSPRASAGAAHRLMGQVLYPRYTRALFGMDALKDELNPEGLSPDFDLKPIRKIVADFVESLREP